MSLRDWEQRNKWLVAHRATREEISEIIAVGDRDLTDSRVAGLSADTRLATAYGAALQFATAALAAAGYRPARGESHHYRIIQSLPLTLGWDADRVEILDKFRKKRNVSSYERAGTVSDRDAGRMQQLAEGLRADLLGWLREHHAGLL
ncbi:MAG TPA: hypothetical protein VM364_11580 [Vicinamibacterales bacterium]|nr:hypothetical protein [Vicinamibacterales bacterium]